MENGLADHLINHISNTNETKQQRPADCGRPCVDGLETDCSCGHWHTAAETMCRGKHTGKHDAYIMLSTQCYSCSQKTYHDKNYNLSLVMS